MPPRYVGENVPKRDAFEKALGKAQYINDIRLPGMLLGKILRSPYSHARILSIDVSRARELPGVKAVITAEDLPGGLYGPFIKDEPVLARDKVRYIGEPVAAVAAVDLETAEDALDLIEVEYEELPAVFDPLEAMEPDAPLIHEKLKEYFCVFEAVQKGNVCSKFTVSEGDVDRGFEEADVIVEDTLETQMVHQSYIEPCGAMAAVDPSGKVTVWSSSQGIFVTQARVSESLKIPMARIRVIAPRVGGAFGGKVETHVQPICVALAQQAEKPVKIIFTRDEELSAGRPRHPTRIKCKLGFRKDGTLVAKYLHGIFDSGAYSDDGPGVLGFGMMMGRGPYRVPNLKMEGFCVYTNKVKTGAFRGFGNPQTTFASECVMDMAARELNMDPLALRMKNALDPGDEAVGGQVLQSVGIKECLAMASAKVGWERGVEGKPEPRPRHWKYSWDAVLEKAGKTGKCRGRGLAALNHISGLVSGAAIVRVNEDGTIVLQVGNMDLGQGSDTLLSQICAEALDVPFEDVNLLTGDTDATPYTWATAASRTTWTAGNAVKKAALDARQQLLGLAARTLKVEVDDLVLENKKISLKKDPQVALAFRDLGAISCWVCGGPIIGKASFHVEEPAMDRSRFQGFPFGTMTAYIFGVQAAEVEVDIETGEITILRGASAHDVGRAINPINVEGQIEGGYVQGVGYALMEGILFDGGQVVNPSLADYKIPAPKDTPPVESIIVEAYDETGPYGAKGVGEASLVAVAPAIANAVYDAVGVRIKELPITPEKVLQGLRELRGR